MVCLEEVDSQPLQVFKTLWVQKKKRIVEEKFKFASSTEVFVSKRAKVEAAASLKLWVVNSDGSSEDVPNRLEEFDISLPVTLDSRSLAFSAPSFPVRGAIPQVETFKTATYLPKLWMGQQVLKFQSEVRSNAESQWPHSQLPNAVDGTETEDDLFGKAVQGEFRNDVVRPQKRGIFQSVSQTLPFSFYSRSVKAISVRPTCLTARPK